MRAFIGILTIVIAFSFGCQKSHQYARTGDEILNSAKNLSGEIYISEGADGPYRDGPGMVGNVNVAGSFFVTTRRGPQPNVAWPATPGYYYEVASYINKEEEAFYLVRKIAAPK